MIHYSHNLHYIKIRMNLCVNAYNGLSKFCVAQVGVATFVGLALFVVAIPPTLFIFFLLSIFRKEKLVFTDERVKLMNELFAGLDS